MNESKNYLNTKNEVRAIKEYCESLFLNGTKFDSINILSNRGLQISKDLDYGFGVRSMYYLLGRSESKVGSMDEAVKYYLTLIDLCKSNETNKTIELAAKAYHGIGLIKDNQGKHEEAKKYFT